MAEPKCKDCKFWRQSFGAEWGECHRRAPSPIISGSTAAKKHTHWPITLYNQWCAEFRVRPSGEAGIEFLDLDDSNEPQNRDGQSE